MNEQKAISDMKYILFFSALTVTAQVIGIDDAKASEIYKVFVVERVV